MNFNEQQKAAVRKLLALADSQGLTANWVPGTGLSVSFWETIELVPMVIDLEEIAKVRPDLLAVIEADPVVDFEMTNPRIVVRLGPRMRQLVKEGYFE